MVPNDDVDEHEVRMVAERWLRARETCDVPALARLTAAEALWESPIDGPSTGRAKLIEQVEAAFADTDDFATETLSLEVRGNRAVAAIRNQGARAGERLDSLQTLFLTVDGGAVSRVRVTVDDPAEVEAFWQS